MSRTAHNLPDRLLETGCMEGPFRRPRAMTVTRWQRFTRWLRATFPNWRTN